MPDDQNLEAQLAAFGRTLESETGEPIRSGSNPTPSRAGRVPRRWWAIGGAAAAGVLAVVGLVAVANRGGEGDVEPAAPQTTLGILSPTTTEAIDLGEVPAAPEPVPTDPLGLEADGWRLVERDELPFEFPADLACPGTDALVELNGASSVRDIVEPPDSTGVDVDVNVIDVGSVDVGNAVADGFLALGECLGRDEGAPPVEVSAMSSIRASWFRVGPEFAIATVVGEGPRTIVLEIENGVFDDELIADLVQRSAAFLGTTTPAGAPTTTVLAAVEEPASVVRLPLVEFDGDPDDFSCGVVGGGFSGDYDYAPEPGPDEPAGRQPFDAFLDAYDRVVSATDRVPSATGWSEWFSDGDSYFVLELGGDQVGLVTVAGWSDLGVWRYNSIDLCESAFVPSKAGG